MVETASAVIEEETGQPGILGVLDGRQALGQGAALRINTNQGLGSYGRSSLRSILKLSFVRDLSSRGNKRGPVLS